MKFNETKSQEQLINLMLQAGVEWPEGGTHAAQDRSGYVWVYGVKPYRDNYSWCPDCVSGGSAGKFPVASNWHQTIITREQYEARDGWITWHGGDCPVDDGELIDAVWGGEAHHSVKGDECEWINFCEAEEVTAYRTHKKAEPVKECIPDQATIEQRIAKWRGHDAALAELGKAIERVREELDRAKVEAEKSRREVEQALADAGWPFVRGDEYDQD